MSARRLFPHFSEGSPQLKRVELALTLFTIVLLATTLGLVVKHRAENRSYEDAVSAVRMQVDDLLTHREELAVNRFKLAIKAKLTFSLLHGRSMNESSGDLLLFSELITQVLEPVLEHRPGSTDFLSEYVGTQVKARFLHLQNTGPIVAWVVVGVAYFCSILLLYRVGLDPGVGEPAFNLIDVGFLAVLVQYTGGFRGLFVLTFVFSIFLAAHDFALRGSEMPDRTWLSRLLVVMGPYVFALLANLFWATAEPAIRGQQPWSEYLTTAGQVGVFALAFWLGSYVVAAKYVAAGNVAAQAQEAPHA